MYSLITNNDIKKISTPLSGHDYDHVYDCNDDGDDNFEMIVMVILK